MSAAAPSGSETGAPSIVRATAAAALTTTLTVLPVFLVGAVAVQVRADLGFTEQGLGVAAAAFWFAMAITGTPGGRFAQRIGPTRAIRFSVVICSLALLGASTVSSLAQLVGWMVVAGAISGLGNPATDLTVAWTVPERVRGIAFGIKQSAVPIATLLAGLAVPLLALTFGWRWAFVGAAAISIPVLVLMPSVPVRAVTVAARNGRRTSGIVVLLAAAAGLAMSAVTAMGAFFVASANAAGLPPERAGLLLAVGSVAGILGRLFFAWGLANTMRPFLAVAVLTGLGGSGTALIAAGVSGPLLVLATLIAFGTGWGWNGLFVHAVVRANPDGPAAAMGIVVSATATGGVAGPLLFGFLATTGGYSLAWSVTSALFLGAGALMFVGSRRIGE
jgi:predicted MFS family arabinose efflux permease